MLRISNISKYFADQIILKEISFTVARGQKIAVIGPNGGGKSTLLKIIAGLLEPDQGSISIQPGANLGYLSQNTDEENSDTTIGAFLAPDNYAAKVEMGKLELAMATSTNAESAHSHYGEQVERFERSGGYGLESRVVQILHGLSMHDLELDRRMNTLSGGQRTKLALARVLLLDADILLLDEPTNSLDTEALRWLEESIKSSRAGYLIVSHDRRFLDIATTRTFELDPATGTLNEYGGNFSWYCQRKNEEEERHRREYKERQDRIRKLKADVQGTKDHALATENATQNDYLRGRSKKVAANAKARETRLNRLISDQEQNENARAPEKMRLQLDGHRLYDRILLETSDLSVTYGSQQVLANVNLFIKGSARIAICGTNGSGKSTLIRALLGEISPSTGAVSIAPDLLLCYLAQTENGSGNSQTVYEFFTESLSHHSSIGNEIIQLRDQGKARTFLHRFQFTGDQVFQKIEDLSRGEQIKLRFATFMALNPQLLVLDEPTNHLDIPALGCLETSLRSFKGALIVVSHDRFFLEGLSIDSTWTIENGTVNCAHR